MTPLAHGLIGQSNQWGKGSTTYPCLGRHYRFSISGRVVDLQDGSGNLLANSMDGGQLGGSVTNRENGTFSLEGAFCDALVASGVRGPHITVPCGRNGSSSLQWIDQLTTSPVRTSGSGVPTYVEEAKHRIRNALEITGAQLGSIIIYQGETNALNSTAATWDDDWGAVRAEFNSFFAPWWASSIHFGVIQLPPTVPTDLAPWPEWAAVRAAQAAFVAANADCVMVTADESALKAGEDFHLETASLILTGTAMGEALAPYLVS